MGGKQFSLIILFLSIIPITFANFDYNETGNYNTYYEQGTGFFNADLSGTDLYTRAVDEPKLTPYVSDLDHDGTNEIIIFDSSGVKLFNNKELDIIDAFSFPNEDLSNALMFNIDGDNYTEIIIALENSQILHIIEYNGSDIFNNSFSFPHLNHTPNADIQIKCMDIDQCIMVYANSTTGTSAVHPLYAVFFNSSVMSKEYVVDAGSIGDRWCKPNIPSIAVADYDGDGEDEYIFAFSSRDGAGDFEPNIYWVNISYNGIDVEEHIAIDDSDLTVIPTCVHIHPFSGMSAPIVFDVDGNAGNGLETVIAYKVSDQDDYVLKTYDGCNSEGCGITQLDDYPESCIGFFGIGNCPEAKAISNVVRADIFAGTEGVDDFCVIGYNDDDSELDMICGSETSTEDSGIFDSETMELVLLDIPFNTSFISPAFHNGIVHSAQHSSSEPTGKNLDEFVTTYGILSADNTDTSTPDLTIIFANPKQNASLISVDAEKVGREDLIALASTNVWYIDDQFTNEGGQITDYCIGPCMDSTIQINSSSYIFMEVTDKDSLKEGAITDLVSARVIIYLGESNEQDTGWSNNYTSGTTITFDDTLIYNATTGSSTLRLMGRDLGSPDDEHIIDFTYSVANAGVVLGDCETCASIPLTAEDIVPTDAVIEDATLIEDATSNAITRGVLTIAGLVGLGGTTLWLLGMMIMNLLIWFVMAEERHMSGSSTFGTIAITDFLAVILGARLGLFGAGLVVILTLLLIVIVGVFLGKFFTGLHSSET